MKDSLQRPPGPAGRDTVTDARKVRLAAALRDNLRKRKAQARSRAESPSSGASKDKPDSEDG